MLVLLAFILYFAQLALSLHSKNNQVYQDMSGTKKIKTALVSVFHKDGLDELLAKLNAEGVKFLSTGGTQKFIESLGYECQTVESVTTYPSILGGRVKTLHPKIFGGILGRRDNEGDREQMGKSARHPEQKGRADRHRRPPHVRHKSLRSKQPLRHGNTQLV